jgi:hypothetical protein
MAAVSSTRRELERLLADIQSTPKWQVNTIGGHYQVVNPDGDSITCSSTPSSKFSITKVKQDLAILGWDPVVAAKERKTKAQEATDADRAKNEAKIAKAAQEAAAKHAAEIQKLRGKLPPGSRVPGSNPPEYVGFQREVKVITPFDALVILKQQETAICSRRKLKVNNERELRYSMEAGEFLFTPENPVFDEHGCLVQGQHRIEAIAQCDPDELEAQYGYPGIMLEIVVNAPAKINSVFDTGISRSPADVLALNGVTQDENAVAAALGLLLAYDNYKTTPWDQYNRIRLHRNDRLKAYLETYSDLTGRPMEDARVLQRAKIAMTKSVGLTFAYIVHRDLPELDEEFEVVNPAGDTHTTSKWAQFRAALVTGFDMPSGSPIAPLRDFLLSDDRTKYTNNRQAQLFLALKAVDLWRKDKKVQKLEVDFTEPIARFK